MGFPPSMLSSTANSLDLSCINLANLYRYLALSLGAVFDQIFNPSFAELTAESTSFLFPIDIEANTSSVDGDTVLRYFLEFGVENLPSIKCPYFDWIETILSDSIDSEYSHLSIFNPLENNN